MRKPAVLDLDRAHRFKDPKHKPYRYVAQDAALGAVIGWVYASSESEALEEAEIALSERGAVDVQELDLEMDDEA